YKQLTYDANGNILSSRNRAGQVISYSYDALNHLTHKGGSAVADVDYTFDLLGRQLTAKFSSSGLGITNSFDALSRLTAEAGPLGTTNRQFDLAGNPTGLSSTDYTVQYQPLVTGEMSAVRDSSGTLMAGYTYDSIVNRAS